jgi:hypothetical protein
MKRSKTIPPQRHRDTEKNKSEIQFVCEGLRHHKMSPLDVLCVSVSLW